MNHQRLQADYHFTQVTLYPSRKDYHKEQHSLSMEQKFTATPTMKTFRVCTRYRNALDPLYISVREDSTLIELKDEIRRRLDLKSDITDFSLTKFSDWSRIWITIENSNGNIRIIDLEIPFYAILNVEQLRKNDTNHSDTTEIQHKDWTLKLCKQPMIKSDTHYLQINSSITIAQLKEEARKLITSLNTRYLYLWTKDGWTQLESNLDDVSLAEAGIDQYSIFSFEMDHDLIPGVCGLTNLGSTCFMNSALQCLSNIPEFTRKVLSFGSEMNAPLIGAFSILIKTIWSGKYSFTAPSSLLLNIAENLRRFPQYRQHDAQEFMNCFLHSIHQELTNEKTLITDLFYGHMQSSVSCLRCCSVDTTEEVISFLPLPVENNINQYNVLYLQTNGEQKLLSISTCSETIDGLIESFIKKYHLKILSKQIGAFKIAYNQIIEEYLPNTLLRDITKDQLTFIERPEKSVDQIYIKCTFRNYKTYKTFRSPIFFVMPLYDCRYSDLSEQIIKIRDHFCSVTKAPTTACHFYWYNTSNTIHKLDLNKIAENDQLLFIKEINFEVDPEWIDKYINQYNLDRLSSNTSLNNLLADFFREEPLEGEYYCSKCIKLTKAKQKANLMLPLPPVLIIQLKRFTYDVYSNEKIDTHIEFPLQGLDLSPYIIKNNNHETNVESLYDLIAVSNHQGSLIGGHYTTYAKNDGNKKWYSFNDEYTREITDEKDVVTKNAYILVYVHRRNQ